VLGSAECQLQADRASVCSRLPCRCVPTPPAQGPTAPERHGRLSTSPKFYLTHARRTWPCTNPRRRLTDSPASGQHLAIASAKTHDVNVRCVLCAMAPATPGLLNRHPGSLKTPNITSLGDSGGHRAAICCCTMPSTVLDSTSRLALFTTSGMLDRCDAPQIERLYVTQSMDWSTLIQVIWPL
jgi:hypothetical protein